MLNKNDFLRRYPDLDRVDDAYSIDGEKLGHVVDMSDDSVTIQKGLFFPKDFTFRYDDVVDVRNRDVVLNLKKADLDTWRSEKYSGWEEYDNVSGRDREAIEETSIPLHEEELEAHKVTRQKGEVRLRKVVHTEMKSFTVPVQKEEVIVERIPADQARDLRPGEEAFKEKEISMPIMEEDVEVTKREKLTGEVRLHKETRTEQEKVSGEVRKEEIDIDKDHDKRKAA